MDRMPEEHCTACAAPCGGDRPIFLLEVIEPDAVGVVVQLCSPRCIQDWLTTRKALRTPPSGG